jgi:CRISPR-associated protein Csb2
MLVLSMELLTGVYRAALPDGSGVEWPPHPERLFSALVQGWGDGGRVDVEMRALEWLERQPPPEIDADVINGVSLGRSTPDVYVPPNDAPSSALEAIPALRKRQPRTFHAVTPQTPLVRFKWPTAQPDAHTQAALAAIVQRTAYVGHPSSLTRLHVSDSEAPNGGHLPSWRPCVAGHHRIRVPHPGRLSDLERWFHAKPQTRPRTGVTAFYRVEGSESDELRSAAQSEFGGESEWVVFGTHSFSRFRPDIFGFAHVARRVRHALMSLSEVQPAPELLSGHCAPGKPSLRAHLAVVPLCDVGYDNSEGDLRGLAIVFPRDADADERKAVRRAVAEFAGLGLATSALPQLHFGSAGSWSLLRMPEPELHSLRPGRYCRRSLTWASVTPVMLDRHPDRNDPVEEARLIAQSCTHIGLPEPLEIEVHKHSSIRAARSAYPSARLGSSWSFPSAKLSGRARRHVVLRFEEPVAGPILIGAGRYQGFGLCLPVGGGR